jgi:hypothetical protein
MLARYGELYWRRDHQLPGVLVCPSHDSPLADSRVVLSHKGKHEFVAADEVNCPADPALPVWAGRPEVINLLREIATVSASLLTCQPAAAHSLTMWGEEYGLSLRARGLARGSAYIDRPALLGAYLVRFGPILDILHQAAPDYWLECITRKHLQSFVPLRHILIQLLINFLPMAEAVNPFGLGPWSCRNPLADHHGQLVITDCSTHKERSKTIGVFRCVCGYAFSTAPEPGSLVKILDLGPLFEIRLRELIANDASLSRTASSLHIHPQKVKRYAALMGLETHWNPLRENVNPQIKRESMRAAWTNGHATSPDLGRKQLRCSIPSVYAWLYLHDRDWLTAQPPAAVFSGFNRRRKPIGDVPVIVEKGRAALLTLSR